MFCYYTNQWKSKYHVIRTAFVLLIVMFANEMLKLPLSNMLYSNRLAVHYRYKCRFVYCRERKQNWICMLQWNWRIHKEKEEEKSCALLSIQTYVFLLLLVCTYAHKREKKMQKRIDKKKELVILIRATCEVRLCRIIIKVLDGRLFGEVSMCSSMQFIISFTRCNFQWNLNFTWFGLCKHQWKTSKIWQRRDLIIKIQSSKCGIYQECRQIYGIQNLFI